MYLVKVLEAVDLQIFNWRKKLLQQWARLRTILMKYEKAMSLGLHLTDYTRIVMAHLLLPFLKDEKTMRVYGVADKPHYMDISNFPTSYYNPCRRDLWNVACVVYDTTSEQFERFDRYTTLQSLCTALDHQVEDGLMRQQECDRMRFIVGKSWDLKLQIHLLEHPTQLADVIVHIISLMLDLYLEDVIPNSLFVCVYSQLYDDAALCS